MAGWGTSALQDSLGRLRAPAVHSTVRRDAQEAVTCVVRMQGVTMSAASRPPRSPSSSPGAATLSLRVLPQPPRRPQPGLLRPAAAWAGAYGASSCCSGTTSTMSASSVRTRVKPGVQGRREGNSSAGPLDPPRSPQQRGAWAWTASVACRRTCQCVDGLLGRARRTSPHSLSMVRHESFHKVVVCVGLRRPPQTLAHVARSTASHSCRAWARDTLVQPREPRGGAGLSGRAGQPAEPTQAAAA
jgi:hypothetical protein